MTVALVLVFAIAGLVLLLWLLFWQPSGQFDVARSALQIKELLPIHCRHFSQLQHILKNADEEFLRARASKGLLREWRAERNRVLRLYIHGLQQDFRNLKELARLISALSPQLRQRQEWELLLLELQFSSLYRVTLARLAMRGTSPKSLPRLAEIVSRLGLELEQCVDRIVQRVPEVGITTS